jgi:hypothetical protein
MRVRHIEERDMIPSQRCPDCREEMEIGFVPDYYAKIVQSRWHPGLPTRTTILGNLQLDADAMIPITTFRCPECGLLKQFAMPSA